MDLNYDSEVKRQCFKCLPPVFISLNLSYNSTNGIIILWNKFQIFLYEHQEFETPSKIITPEFQIKQFKMSNNYLLTLDFSGNIHILSLKFKTTQSKLKFSFSPKEQRIIQFTLLNDNFTVSLKCESRTYSLYLYNLSTKLLLLQKILLIPSKTEMLPCINEDKCILLSYKLTEDPNIMEKSYSNKDSSLIILSTDRLSVFYCILDKSDQLDLKRLYTCPSEISNIEIIQSDQIYILIGLTIGSIIKLTLTDSIPTIIHLNSAISKFLSYNNCILYSDGICLWKTDLKNVADLEFEKLFVKQVKDFIKINDTVVCTTYTNMIYAFQIEECAKSEPDLQYCPAEKLLNNYEYLNQIMEEIKQNDDIVKKISKEKDYITALALSHRQDIMDNIIKQNILVFETYNEAISESPNIELVNNYIDYFNSQSLFFLIQITVPTDNKLTNILSDSSDLIIHVTLFSNKLLKTVSIKITEKLRKLCLLLPMKENLVENTELHIDTRLICAVPAAFNKNKKIWSILYQKRTVLKSEHFVRTNNDPKRVVLLKEPETTLPEQILQAAQKLNTNLFDFTDILKTKPSSREWSLYVRLPVDYNVGFKEESLHTELNKQKNKFILQQLSSSEFLNSKTSISWQINDEKVKIETEIDGFSNPVLKVTSNNLKVALDIRDFLSNLYYKDIAGGREFVNHSFYITVENLQKAIRDSLRSSSEEDLLLLVEQFERNVIGVMPV